MHLPKLQPVDSVENLRFRVDRLFRGKARKTPAFSQLTFGEGFDLDSSPEVDFPSKDISGFLNFISGAMPDGDVFLFGGVLRDLALLGRKGFNSDIDLVVEGDWSNFVSYLESKKACKNKFGGYRLIVGKWPVDIWNAEDTWACREGLVRYNGIASLLETTVLNWDAILMNWRTREFISRANYFEEINQGLLDIVLEQNPNQLGMAVRVFRHLYLKDARKITEEAAVYLARCTKKYCFEEIKNAEFRSYRNAVIQRPHYETFKKMNLSSGHDVKSQFVSASNIIEKELELRV